MKKWFWAKRFGTSFMIAGPVLFAVHAVKGYNLATSAAFGCIWGVIGAAIFTLVGYIRYKRNPACMLSPRDSR